MRSIIQDGSDDWPPTKEGALHIQKEEKMMEIRLEDIEKALESLAPNSSSVGDEIKELIDKLKVKFREGNVDRVQIRKDDEIILKVPVNVGIIGGLIGAAAAPWALIAGTIAAFGFGCKLEIVKKDGSTDEIV